jgi:hypothetical protein
MAKLYKKTGRGVTFACYSERGIVAYFMLRVLPADSAGFLRQIVDGAGAAPFATVLAGQIANLSVFSELAFGSKYGFGNPDGALYFEIGGTAYMIFYEAKINETYQQSCKGVSYNSTIQGQLELKWRVVTLYHQGSVQTYKGTKYIEETDEFRAFYSDKDKFYDPSAEEEDPSLASHRHLALKEGVKKVFDEYVSKCGPERVYFLASTNDPHNPFTDAATPLPRCHGKTWEEVRHRFCWINNSVIEDCPAV